MTLTAHLIAVSPPEGKASNEMTCLVDVCQKPMRARGLCWGHYKRLRKYGDPLARPGRKAPDPCHMEPCRQRAKRHGLCDKHASRWRKWGDPFYKPECKTLEERLMEKIEVQSAPGCRWIWTGAKLTTGNGVIAVGGKLRSAQRIVYELVYEHPVPAWAHVTRLCGNKGCVTPEHLETGRVEQKLARARAAKASM